MVIRENETKLLRSWHDYVKLIGAEVDVRQHLVTMMGRLITTGLGTPAEVEELEMLCMFTEDAGAYSQFLIDFALAVRDLWDYKKGEPDAKEPEPRKTPRPNLSDPDYTGSEWLKQESLLDLSDLGTEVAGVDFDSMKRTQAATKPKRGGKKK